MHGYIGEAYCTVANAVIVDAVIVDAVIVDAVIVEKMIGFTYVRVSDKNIFIAIAVVVAHRYGGPARCEHVQDPGILAMKGARMMPHADARLCPDLLKSNRPPPAAAHGPHRRADAQR